MTEITDTIDKIANSLTLVSTPDRKDAFRWYYGVGRESTHLEPDAVSEYIGEMSDGRLSSRPIDLDGEPVSLRGKNHSLYELMLGDMPVGRVHLGVMQWLENKEYRLFLRDCVNKALSEGMQGDVSKIELEYIDGKPRHYLKTVPFEAGFLFPIQI